MNWSCESQIYKHRSLRRLQIKPIFQGIQGDFDRRNGACQPHLGPWQGHLQPTDLKCHLLSSREQTKDGTFIVRIILLRGLLKANFEKSTKHISSTNFGFAVVAPVCVLQTLSQGIPREQMAAPPRGKAKTLVKKEATWNFLSFLSSQLPDAGSLSSYPLCMLLPFMMGNHNWRRTCYGRGRNTKRSQAG